MARPRLTDVHPIVPVRDLRAALEHYRALGFRVQPYADGDDYGFADRGGVQLHLTYQPSSYYGPGAIGVLYLDVDDADALFAEWSAVEGGQISAPEDMPWGRHEGIYRDPDGNVIRFGSPM